MYELFWKKCKKNIVYNCYVYKTAFSEYGGGIVGKFCGCNNGELLIMNCIFSGSDMEYQGMNTVDGNYNTGGIVVPI